MTSIIYKYDVDGVTRYVGSTFDYNYKTRQRAHRNKLKSKRGIERDHIAFSILESCKDAIRFEREGHYIDIYLDLGNELWNIKDPRKLFPNNLIRGGHHSEETLAKISAAHKGKPASAEARQKMSESHKGQIGEHNSFYGRKHSEESKKKMSDANKGKKKGPSKLRGRKRPDISAALKGRKNPKTSERLKGKPNPEHSAKLKGKPSPLKGRKRPNLSAALKGRVISEDQRKILSEMSKLYHNAVRNIQIEYQEHGEECSWKQAIKIWKLRSLR